MEVPPSSAGQDLAELPGNLPSGVRDWPPLGKFDSLPRPCTDSRFAARGVRQGRQGRQGRVHHSKTMADLLPKRLHLNTFPSRSGSIHFGSPPKLVRWPFATFLFVPNGCSKHQTCTFRSKQSRAEQQRRHGRQGGQTERFCLMSSRNAHFEASRAERRRRRQGRQSRQGRQTEQTGVQQRPRWDATG